jgi:hypothetical protein
LTHAFIFAVVLFHSCATHRYQPERAERRTGHVKKLPKHQIAQNSAEHGSVPLDLSYRIRFEMPVSMETGAIIEYAAMLLGGGSVTGTNVLTEWFSYDVSRNGCNVEIKVRRHRFGWLPFNLAFPSQFNLMRGLTELGCDLRVDGPWAQFFPISETPQECPGTIRWKLTPRFGKERGMQFIELTNLSEIHQTFDSVRTFDELQQTKRFRATFPEYESQDQPVIESILDHPSGLTIQTNGNWHKILGSAPPPTEAEQQQIESAIKEVVNPNVTTKTTRDETLSILMPKQPFKDLLQRLDKRFSEFLKTVSVDIEEEYAASDYGRSPIGNINPRTTVLAQGVICKLQYERPTAQMLIDSGLPQIALEYLRKRNQPFESSTVMNDCFTLQCENHIIWGDSASGILILKENPSVSYWTR